MIIDIAFLSNISCYYSVNQNYVIENQLKNLCNERPAGSHELQKTVEKAFASVDERPVAIDKLLIFVFILTEIETYNSFRSPFKGGITFADFRFSRFFYGFFLCTGN
jgi:hypothetical protein